MTRPLDGLEPALLWERFFELTQIARPPKSEGPVREHVLAWASERRLDARVDEAGNVVAAVPARPGRESAPPVALQAHLDMVCERDPESPYDPREGRIGVVVDGDWVAADGTTLGADDGIGVAAALAIAEDGEFPHGPLELLFTVSEEQGLTGAQELDPSLVSGRLLVNLDGASDEGVTVGCAGSIHTYVRRSFDMEVPLRRGLDVRVSGARGGHSGEDIASGRANANKVLGRILARAYWRPRSSPPFRLVLLEGGVSRNAIPREARAVVAAYDPDEFRTVAVAEFDTLRKEFATTDPDLAVDLEWSRLRYAVDDSSTGSLVHLISELPTGVVAMSPDRPDVVETSTSLTVVQTDEDRQLVTFGSMTRSASPTALDEVASQIEEIAEEADADVELVRSYPPWEPRLDSTLLDAATRTYRRLFGAELVLTVVHGGLECAVLGKKLPGVEMISIGPEIVGPHAPGEKVRISSVQRFYRLLGELLDELSRGSNTR
jgi:dipeptidase D